MQFSCIPGNDGGIKQSFFVEVIDDYANEALCDNVQCFPIFLFIFILLFPNFPTLPSSLQVFDGKEKIFNVSSDQPTFQLVRLPSDARLTVKVNMIDFGDFSCKTCRNKLKFCFFSLLNSQQITPFNLQGMCKDSYQLRVKTIPAPLMRTGKSHISSYYLSWCGLK